MPFLTFGIISTGKDGRDLKGTICEVAQRKIFSFATFAIKIFKINLP